MKARRVRSALIAVGAVVATLTVGVAVGLAVITLGPGSTPVAEAPSATAVRTAVRTAVARVGHARADRAAADAAGHRPRDAGRRRLPCLPHDRGGRCWQCARAADRPSPGGLGQLHVLPCERSAGRDGARAYRDSRRPVPPVPQVDHAGRGGPAALPHRERELPLVPRLDRPAAGQHEGEIRGHLLPVPQGNHGRSTDLPAQGAGRRQVPDLPRGLGRGRAARGPRRPHERPVHGVPRARHQPATRGATRPRGLPGDVRVLPRAEPEAEPGRQREPGAAARARARLRSERPGARGATGRGPPELRKATDGPTRSSPPSADDGTDVPGPASLPPTATR